MKTALPEFDPVVSILIREMASLPDYSAPLVTDELAHNWLMENEPAFYGGLCRLAGEIRSAICDEIGNADVLYMPNDASYTSAVCDCIRLIETRGEGPL